MISRKEVSIWAILKNCIGKDLSKITMPVMLNEPLSFLQRLCEYMEYAQLLTEAAQQEHPADRMKYVAGECYQKLGLIKPPVSDRRYSKCTPIPVCTYNSLYAV